MKNIIEKLYDLYINEQDSSKETVKKDLKNDEEWVVYNNFYNRLDEKQKSAYREFEDILFFNSYQHSVEAFKEGFKQGASLILDCLEE